MSDFNLTWRKYGLKDNPYFNGPLTLDGGFLDLSAFIGREKERQELKSIIQMGGEIRCMVIGEPGVGKTSLVNFVRNEASQNGFFTPLREIEINRVMPGNEVIVLTINAIYSEIKRRGLKLNETLMQKLAALYELTQYGELSHDIANLVQLNKGKLMELFNELIKEIVHPRFKGIIIHYDNLDNIFDLDGLVDMISDIRDFLLNQKVIFIFVGDSYLPNIIGARRRVGQIFLTPAVEVGYLSFEEIKKILDERMKKLKADGFDAAFQPHSDDALRTLYELHGGNLREILNSLTRCIVSLPPSNTPILVTKDLLSDTLYNKFKESYLSKLTDVEKQILSHMLKKEMLTPTELSEISGKSLANISSKYIPALKEVGVIRLRGVEGRNRYYEISQEAKWWKLKRSEVEQIKSREEVQEEIERIVQTHLGDFL